MENDFERLFMNKLWVALVLLVASNSVLPVADQKVMGVMRGKNVVTHYTTGPLTEDSSQAVLDLISQLKKYVKSRFNPFNLMLGQTIRKQLAQGYNLRDVTTIEQLLKDGALVLVSNDHAIFVVRNEYLDILQDCFPDISFEQDKTIVLPGSFEEVNEVMKEISVCSENEFELDVERQKLNKLQQNRYKLQQERLLLESAAKDILGQIGKIKAELAA